MLMATLADLGLQIDCSAFPGRRRNDAERRFDWATTPPHPYHPSAGDYRVPGDDPLRIVELPLAMVEIMASYDPRPMLRYLNLAYDHDRLRQAMPSLNLDATYFQTVIHPEEISGRRPSNGLYAFTLENVERNLDFLLEAMPDHRCPTI